MKGETSQSPISMGDNPSIFPSQLPTPQTHSTTSILPYFPGITRSPVSPLAYANRRTIGNGCTSVLGARTFRRPATPSPGEDKPTVLPPHIVTPDASPSRQKPQKRPSSAPLPSVQLEHLMFESESVTPLLSPLVSTPPRMTSQRAGAPTPGHNTLELSSPFVEKGGPERQKPNIINGLSPDLVTPQPLHTPNIVELLSPVQIGVQQREVPTETSTSPADESSRPAGGELERIRQQISSLEKARQTELENRRPDFLKRVNRMDLETIGKDYADGVTDNLGIMESPVKGRRIQLLEFQQTSEESFEQSLMTRGYVPYGGARTPQELGSDSVAKEGGDILAQGTPAGSAASLRSGEEEELTEKELKKRKRLEAFVGSAARINAKLYPAEVEGFGRVLINVPPEEAESLFNAATEPSTPSKKRTPKRRRITSAEKRAKLNIAKLAAAASTPHWLDQEFPWSIREKERVEERDKRNAERLERINRYLSRDTDSEDESARKEGSRSPSPSVTMMKSEELRPGRGKGVPLQTNPVKPRAVGLAINSSQFYPSDPADARTALMSKRAVRLLAYRHARKLDESENRHPTGLCICGSAGDEDDRAQVQCDECFTWYHTDCLGIKDITELGDPDDPYYCYLCRPDLHATTSNSSYLRGTTLQREPTLVPTEENLAARGTHDIAFYTSSPLSTNLQTPTRGSFRGYSRRSLWDDAHNGGPSTPLGLRGGIRIFTPNGDQAPYNPFLESPIRGPVQDSDSHKDSSGYATFVTPKGWPIYFANGQTHTPIDGRGGPFAFGYGFGTDDSGNGSGNFGSYGQARIGAADDTPIRRAPRRQTRSLVSLRAAGSPLAGRGEWTLPNFVPIPGESPITRGTATTKRARTQVGQEIDGTA